MKRVIIIGILVLLTTIVAQGQVTIGGNVYGGGNSADVGGSAKVTVRGGNLNKVFGGARMANIGGNTYVNIDGKNAAGYILINHVYGGNDIAGTVGTAAAVGETLPTELVGNPDGVDNTWNAYVHLSSKMDATDPTVVAADNQKMFIGQLFAGGNGDYFHDVIVDSPTAGKTTHNIYLKEGDTTPIVSKVTASGESAFTEPELDKTYLDIHGGTIAFGYGGGNNATVKNQTVIHVDNPSKVVNELLLDENSLEDEVNGTNILDDKDRVLRKMGVNIAQEHFESPNFQIGRLFGGNNWAEMDIMPTWNLSSGKVRNLYSGGNRGAMTSPTGLLLEIPVTSSIVVDNVYGGCRMADVKPTVDGAYVPVTNLPGYGFPPNLSARVLVRGGDINNVYGGNDVTGKVWGGNAVGIYKTIRGDVYGGGNGSYAYTDNSELKDDLNYSDYFYGSYASQDESVAALNAFRPNAEQVSIRLFSPDPLHPTIIHGSVFCGGNCATLYNSNKNAMMELKIGSNVIADKVYLGNNGAGMIDDNVLEHYAKAVDANGDVVDSGTDFSSLLLTDPDIFAKYMEGVTMTLRPSIVFDKKANGDPADYDEGTSKIGSFFCGGNVGSMAFEGKDAFEFDHKLVIYNKLVGGCNNANVEAKTGLCAAYEGGVLGTPDERISYTDGSGHIKDRIELNLKNIVIEPRRWKDAWAPVPEGTTLTAGDTYYTSITGDGEFTATGSETASEDEPYFVLSEAASTELVWNTFVWDDGADDFVKTDTETASEDQERRLGGGNVYGGCYNSGHVNGNVTININEDLIKKGEVFAETVTDADENITIKDGGTRNSGVILENQCLDNMAISMVVFGAGYGEKTEIWGSTNVNLNKGYAFIVYGGGEQGVVGRKDDLSGDYVFNPAYSSTVTLNGATPVFSEDEVDDDIAEAEYIFAGGNEGDVCGNTYAYLGHGRVYDVFAGASDADILGHTEAYIGRQPNGSGGLKDGFPFVRDIVYGGNDFGGVIHGNYEDGYNYEGRVRDYSASKAAMLHALDGTPPSNSNPGLLKSSTYVEYYQGRVDSIFGGGYGYYDYSDLKYGGAEMPYIESSFVNIRPKVNSRNVLNGAFGAGTGFPRMRNGDKSQDRSYVLVDIPKNGGTDVDNFAKTLIYGAGSYNGLGMRFRYDPASGKTVDDNDAPINLDKASAIVDLLHGKLGNVFGGSYNEGITRRTVVNVPEGSTITMYTDEPDKDANGLKYEKLYGNIFGGACGTHILPPCDVYESNVNYNSDDATVMGAIYGGNNHERRTLYAKVNIFSPVWSNKEKGYLSTVYGAGLGIDTWSEYTEVNLNANPDPAKPGAKVYEVYGGGMMGHVLNAESIQKYMQLYSDGPSDQILSKDSYWNKQTDIWENEEKRQLKASFMPRWKAEWEDAWEIGTYYRPAVKDELDTDGDGDREEFAYTDYVYNTATNLTNSEVVSAARVDDRNYNAYTEAEKAKRFKRYDTNVRINEGATVVNYAYGGGYGKSTTPLSGDVYGTTYIALLGGTVTKDIYAAGTAGAVTDLFGVYPYNGSTNTAGFTASANAYVEGGSCRNVYGGGWLGNVGNHKGALNASPANDILGETHVIIGRDEAEVRADSLTLAGQGTDKHGFYYGRPTIQRNAYGGGEGGAVFGTAHLTLNNGYIGYQFNAAGTDLPATANIDERYEEKIEDDTKATPNTFLEDAGCLFGGGYIDNSSVDKTEVRLYGGQVRNSAFGGGEVAAIGRGDMKLKTGSSTVYELKGIYYPGKAGIEMYGGHVHKNVYGGGRGYDNLSQHGTLHCDGFVFGQTDVHIHGGEIGTVEGINDGDGNVFGGGDIGFVYSAYEKADGSFGKGVKLGERYKDATQGYYYKHDMSDSGDFEMDGSEYQFTEDCKVLVAPHCKSDAELSFTGIKYQKGERLTSLDYELLKSSYPSVLANIDANRIVTSEDGITFNLTYPSGSYIPTAALNTLLTKNGDTRWEHIDPSGIIIHNAVFAGGNNPSSSTINANTASVFGNATASVNDLFHRDMITLGTRHTGGLYGDGNLTLVDGYRELNITNYGTDYYSIEKEIGIDDYHALPDREADYYELKYTCLKPCQDKEGTRYKPVEKDEGGNVISKASTITADEMQSLFVTEKVINGVTQKVSVQDDGTDILTFDEVKGEWVPSDAGYWEESGVLPVYAGRLMNSIQRADFCGVFGSRMVMQGAKDRVPEEIDYTDYTINRVREVSLNKKLSTAGDATEHGNYFGIYNIVHFLGALTSDVNFGDERSGSGEVRKTDNTDTDTYQCAAGDGGPAYGTATYYDWKKAFIKDRKRNNGSSHNKVALASGVYLELTTEESTGPGLYEKVWGPITGVIELDLINVSTGVGGGFVYAKNVHGIRKPSGRNNTTLTALNENAVTQWDFVYNPPEPAEGESLLSEDDKKEWQTSGNFVHSTQTIIDDCYNISNKYKSGYLPPDGVPAHFWYIKGSVYVYDQYISAYTGIPNAYSETVDIPLTIAAASHGKMKLLNVMPNRYAFYAAPGVEMESGKKIIINDKTYYKNDPISYWDWYLLTSSEKELFCEKTYVNCMTCKIDGDEYEAGTYIMNDQTLATYKASAHTYTDADGNPIKKADNSPADDDYIFRLSNSVSHDNGYILTYEVNNPSIWDNWYTPKNGGYTAKKTLEEYEAMSIGDKSLYYDGPTYRLKDEYTTGMLLGQQNYDIGDIIPKTTEDIYQAIDDSYKPSSGQAEFEEAYIVTNKITVLEGNSEHNYNTGLVVSETFANAHAGSVEPAYICTSTIEITKDDIIYKDSKMSQTEVNNYISTLNGRMNGIKAGYSGKSIDEIKNDASLTDEQRKDLLALASLKESINTNVVRAYYCTKEGKYGGNYYEAGHNYRGLEAWSSLTAEDHEMFVFNYDALDLLIDPRFSRDADGDVIYPEGEKYQYDGNYTSEDQVNDPTTGNKAGYSVTQKIDYTASYNDPDHNLDLGEGNNISVKRGDSYTTTSVIQKDDELTRDVFEALANEQRHYSRIVVKDAGTYYVVNTAFQVGATPYAVGEVISSETYNSLPNKENVTELTFDDAHKNQNYYYCRETFTPSGYVTSLSSSAIPGASGEASGTKGTVITDGQFAALPNQQRNFTIHGVSPTETSTLYVSRESDIYDLSQEKIITVIYQYDYDETDASGNVTPVSERHVVNIHLSFKSGVPIVEDITPPDIILPGDYTTLREPNVTPGAYEVMGGGWELFEGQRDAESHTNGIDYNPTFDPLYWYQDSFYVAYYAKSYLGRTYSNYVPVRVANYHDLAEVMSDENKEHHMYIDNRNVKRDPKIYIKDYSAIDKNGLDLFKNLFDLSLITESGDGYTVSGGKITEVTSSANTALVGHALLNTQTRAERNLEFFLQSDIDHSGSPWTPIGNNGVCDDPNTPGVDEALNGTPKGECFDGVLHGDGYTVSGLDHSLFDYLCGEVYNLGVQGSFTGAGVAEQGGGYVESCWVQTTGIPDATESTGVRAVFGNPSAADGYKQVVNSYCQDTKTYNTSDDGSHGLAKPMPERAYYNGELAYDLNNFYLYKRYNDKETSAGADKTKYTYFTVAADNTLTLHRDEESKYYASNPNLCSSGYNGIKYVENRFADGDYRYAGGRPIRTDEDERYWTETVTINEIPVEQDRWSPIWPDDYIFFGQKLTYGWASDSELHQEVPTAVVRDGGRLSTNADANRVFRAPAYYGSKVMGVAHFNPKAYLAQTKKGDASIKAYPGMTAIDFAGHNDTHDEDDENKPAKHYEAGFVTLSNGPAAGATQFYPPLLDDDGLTSIVNCDETQNLLVYAPAETVAASPTGYVNKKTYDALTYYFVDPVYDSHYDNSDGYRLVDVADELVFGHLVQSDLTATNDHLLVDKQDFNAPINYTFDGSSRMWYQRKPADAEYVKPVWSGDVRTTTGWQGISIPFTAELVTTNEKGEITHFNGGSEISKNGTNTKIGHEYWLREFNSIKKEGTTPDEVAKADFLYPSASGYNKTVTNTFLWDYYYEKSDRKDKNTDIYQEYYRNERSYSYYPLLTKAVPYIIGFPGDKFYEFDLSGNFVAKNTFAAIGQLSKQTITFASETGITIGVSDDEMTGVTKEIDVNDITTQYTFKPNYMNKSFEAGTNIYTMNATGTSFDKVPAAPADATSVAAFRPYFTTAVSTSRPETRSIVFTDGGDGSDMLNEDHSGRDSDAPGMLTTTAERHKIIVSSTLKVAATIHIINTAGITVSTFTIEPGETIETRIKVGGVYIVQTDDGLYTKKLLVK